MYFEVSLCLVFGINSIAINYLYTVIVNKYLVCTELTLHFKLFKIIIKFYITFVD